MYADKPGVWFRVNSDGMEEQLVMSEYLFKLLDSVYNPEYTEWIYKQEYISAF
jgi:hypothetical protein